MLLWQNLDMSQFGASKICLLFYLFLNCTSRDVFLNKCKGKNFSWSIKRIGRISGQSIASDEISSVGAESHSGMELKTTEKATQTKLKGIHTRVQRLDGL